MAALERVALGAMVLGVVGLLVTVIVLLWNLSPVLLFAFALAVAVSYWVGGVILRWVGLD